MSRSLFRSKFDEAIRGTEIAATRGLPEFASGASDPNHKFFASQVVAGLFSTPFFSRAY